MDICNTGNLSLASLAAGFWSLEWLKRLRSYNLSGIPTGNRAPNLQIWHSDFQELFVGSHSGFHCG